MFFVWVGFDGRTGLSKTCEFTLLSVHVSVRPKVSGPNVLLLADVTGG